MGVFSDCECFSGGKALKIPSLNAIFDSVREPEVIAQLEYGRVVVAYDEYDS